MLSRRKFLKILMGLGINIFALTLTNWPTSIIEKLLYSDKNMVDPVPSKSPIAFKNVSKNLALNPIDDVKALAGIRMQGRESGTIGEGKAVEYISNRLDNLGLKPIGESGYEQVFTILPVEKTIANGRVVFIQGDKSGLHTPCVNVLGELPGKKREVILICAHYDHLGIYKNKIYPGANDNASGVACVFDVLKRLIQEGTPKGASIVAAFWSAEEMGFLGSRAFVKTSLIPLSRIKAVINIDSIGTGKTGDFIYWADHENIAVTALKTASISAKANIRRSTNNGHNSDQNSFAKVGIPAVTLLAKNWLEKNHTTKDTIEYIKAEKISKASDIIYRTIRLLDKDI